MENQKWHQDTRISRSENRAVGLDIFYEDGHVVSIDMTGFKLRPDWLEGYGTTHDGRHFQTNAYRSRTRKRVRKHPCLSTRGSSCINRTALQVEGTSLYFFLFVHVSTVKIAGYPMRYPAFLFL